MSEVLALFDVSDKETAFFKTTLGGDVIVKGFSGTAQESDLKTAADATIIAMHTSSKIDSAVISALPKLKLIACRSTGFDHVDLGAASNRGIKVATVPSYGETTVAEFAIMLMLNLSRRLNQVTAAVTSGHIDPTAIRGHDLAGKTLGVIGTGKIGRHVIATAKALSMAVIAFDPFPNQEAASQLGFEYTDLENLLKTSDVITLHAPATEQNRHLINNQALSQMKSSAYLINTARGTLVDTEALIEALAAGRIAGAGLDVVEGEALLDAEQELHLLISHQPTPELTQDAALAALKKMPNVILTGHNAYNTEEAIGRILQTTVDNIKAYLTNRPLNLVEPK